MTFLHYILQGTKFVISWNLEDQTWQIFNLCSKDLFWHLLNLQGWFWLFELSFWLFDFPGSGFWHFPFLCSFLSGFLCFSSVFLNIRTCTFIITKIQYLWHIWLVLGWFGLDLVNKKVCELTHTNHQRSKWSHLEESMTTS